MKVFIAGPRAITRLNEEVFRRLTNIAYNKFTVLIGDANGVDKAVQKYFYSQGYKDVKVYASGGRVRNNEGKWETVNVEVPKVVKGFDFYAAKDYEMAKDADYGLMIWNGKSKGTLNNILNLIKMNKKILLYFTPEKKFYKILSRQDVEDFMKKIDDIDVRDFYKTKSDCIEQLKIEI